MYVAPQTTNDKRDHYRKRNRQKLTLKIKPTRVQLHIGLGFFKKKDEKI